MTKGLDPFGSLPSHSDVNEAAVFQDLERKVANFQGPKNGTAFDQILKEIEGKIQTLKNATYQDKDNEICIGTYSSLKNSLWRRATEYEDTERKSERQSKTLVFTMARFQLKLLIGSLLPF